MDKQIRGQMNWCANERMDVQTNEWTNKFMYERMDSRINGHKTMDELKDGQMKGWKNIQTNSVQLTLL